MIDFFRLLACALTRLFRSRARLEAEILVLRHQRNVLRRRSPKRVALLQRQGSRFLIKENPADAGQGWTKSWRHSMPKGGTFLYRLYLSGICVPDLLGVGVLRCGRISAGSLKLSPQVRERLARAPGRSTSPRPSTQGSCMSMRLRPEEYFVVTSSRGRPPVWTWEIQSRPKPLGIKLGGADFSSEPGAKLAGEKALIEFLDRLGHEEGNVL